MTTMLRPSSAALSSVLQHLILASSWMSVAYAELGQSEVRGAGKQNPRIVQYHASTTLSAQTDETPWCSSFVNWVLRQAGIPGTRSALAASWLSWGTGLDAPCWGAITVIRRIGRTQDAATGSATGNHVAFYLDRSSTHIELLGGNQGDQVKVSRYPLTKYRVRGYRWPG